MKWYHEHLERYVVWAFIAWIVYWIDRAISEADFNEL